jgi:hypothetical protein
MEWESDLYDFSDESVGVPIEEVDNLRSGMTTDRSTRTSRYLSTVQTGQEPRSLRAWWINSGYGACKLASRMPTKLSRPPKPISPRISRRSIFRPWSCKARTTSSFP